MASAGGTKKGRATTGYERHTDADLRQSLKTAEEAIAKAQGRIVRIKREMKRRDVRRGTNKQGNEHAPIE